ncbi:hypothetical protein Cgig2_012390 [Carnegiea gigantea]|uniref:Uncharacterized protein n=1 Tax=Carnegiea gigantea TaxID=171969 RepID=A0A9Q1GXW6_9CARY|nr:hypothetical protein Cgig2_012390 [Carnegiea gigantea]
MHSPGGKDVKETKVQIRNPIAHFSKSKCQETPPSLPSWSKENLKTREIFLLSSHPDAQENVPLFHLLHHDIDAKQKSCQISRSNEIRPSKPSPSPNKYVFDYRIHGWNESHAIFDELGVPKGVGVAISAAPMSAIPIQSVPMLVKAPYEGMSNVQESKLNYRKTIFPPPDGAENVMDILDCDPSPIECIGEFDNLYDLINERGGDASPLKNRVERLIHQAYDLKDLQESYSGRMTIEARESRLIEIDTLNAMEVIDPTTKASLEKTKAYVKESFEDLKTFQWTP